MILALRASEIGQNNPSPLNRSVFGPSQPSNISELSDIDARLLLRTFTIS